VDRPPPQTLRVGLEVFELCRADSAIYDEFPEEADRQKLTVAIGDGEAALLRSRTTMFENYIVRTAFKKQGVDPKKTLEQRLMTFQNYGDAYDPARNVHPSLWAKAASMLGLHAAA
jgi:hypothetical protein